MHNVVGLGNQVGVVLVDIVVEDALQLYIGNPLLKTGQSLDLLMQCDTFFGS